ncbi:LysR family transcriptional regulator [uncultured Pseudoalteromonas sp.]|uniref:LysR family transcriptional regulator n=1 Tax=uncultured Pseudoalteromonas sp. TaxID=114053 RepID=UPI0030C7DD83
MSQFKELRSFVSVVGSGSLSNSAKTLQLSKSTLSRHLKNLEHDIGYTLLKRMPNSLVPTEAGLRFYEYCEQILRIAKQAKHELDTLDEKVQGEVIVYVDNGLLRGWLGDVVAQFLTQYPDVSVTLKTDIGANSNQWREHILLCMGALPETSQRQEKLSLLWQGVFGSQEYFNRNGYPKSPEDLSNVQWLQLIGNENEQLEMTDQRGNTFNVAVPASRIQSDQLVLQGDAISHGHGLGLLPLWQANMRLSAHPGCFERCLDEWVADPLPVWLCYPFGKLAKKQHAFIEHIKSNLPTAWRTDVCKSMQ